MVPTTGLDHEAAAAAAPYFWYFWPYLDSDPRSAIQEKLIIEFNKNEEFNKMI